MPRTMMLGGVALLSVALGGCSYRMDALFSRSGDTAAADVTGSIGSTKPAVAIDSGDASRDSDLAYARSAAARLMEAGAKSGVEPWENPTTGARGTVTAIAAPYQDAGLTCRDFLASYVIDRNETWYQGNACQFAEGRWDVRSMKAWKRG